MPHFFLRADSPRSSWRLSFSLVFLCSMVALSANGDSGPQPPLKDGLQQALGAFDSGITSALEDYDEKINETVEKKTIIKTSDLKTLRSKRDAAILSARKAAIKAADSLAQDAEHRILAARSSSSTAPPIGTTAILSTDVGLGLLAVFDIVIIGAMIVVHRQGREALDFAAESRSDLRSEIQRLRQPGNQPSVSAEDLRRLERTVSAQSEQMEQIAWASRQQIASAQPRVDRSPEAIDPARSVPKAVFSRSTGSFDEALRSFCSGRIGEKHDVGLQPFRLVQVHKPHDVGAPGLERQRLGGLSSLNEDQIAARGARMARRDDRAYREYLREEQRSQTRGPRRAFCARWGGGGMPRPRGGP